LFAFCYCDKNEHVQATNSLMALSILSKPP